MSALRLGIALAASCAWSMAQTIWTQVPTLPPLPAGHAGAAMGLAVQRGTNVQRLMLFGGQSATGFSNATWILGPNGWTQATPSHAPSPRAGVRMDQYAMLFGGYDGQTYLNDTWRYDVPFSGSEDWREIRPSGPLPPGRAYHAQSVWAEDLYIHGGSDQTNVFGDTWVLRTGGNWQQLPAGPSPRTGHQMAHMPQSTTPDLVLFGGLDASGAPLDDTWVLRNENWVRLSPTVRPPARFGHVLAADHLRGGLVLFGGTDGRGTTFRDVWEWNGSNWTQATPAGGPSARWAHSAMFDWDRGGIIVYGGTAQNDTWAYKSAFPPSVTAFDSGCATQGILNDITPWMRGAWLGASFTASSYFALGNPLVFHVMGASKTNWAGGALPFPLATLGGAGCLLVSPEVVIPGRAFACRFPPCLTCYCAQLTVAVPNNPSLAGASLFVQFLDMQTTPSLRLTGSNGLEYVLGLR